MHAYEISLELLQRDFLVDFRPGAGIRVSPHFYNSDEELEAAIREMRQIIDARAYQKHQGKRNSVSFCRETP